MLMLVVFDPHTYIFCGILYFLKNISFHTMAFFLAYSMLIYMIAVCKKGKELPAIGEKEVI